MYDVRQFRTTLYVVLTLGILGFAMAAETPVLWCISCAAILLNAVLVNTDRFRPLPRVVASSITLLALGLVAVALRNNTDPPVLTIGEFLVLLQLIKLYEQRENRDYAQALILSLLLMVSAAISTASFLFAMVFLFYLFSALYCCLLFHVKIETDRARAGLDMPVEKISITTLRQNQRYLGRSMRKLTALVALASFGVGVLVFLFFPRGPGAGMLGPIQLRAIPPLTGFSDHVDFGRLSQITQNNDLVAQVELYYQDRKVVVPGPMLLRGSTLDYYSGDEDMGGRWQWSRQAAGTIHPPVEPSYEPDIGIQARLDDPDGDWKQIISLQPIGTAKLFAMATPTDITMNTRGIKYKYSTIDNILETVEAPNSAIQYTVVSTGDFRELDDLEDTYSLWTGSNIDDAIRRFAMRHEVSGVDASGKSLAVFAKSTANDHSRDLEIAQNISHYLSSNFTYTLNLNGISSDEDVDPIVRFLYEFRRGHCELFAGAMTLLCQSLNIPTRMVVGFRCDSDDFNALGGFYQVKQSNAHAWVEVFADRKWNTFDPTSGHLAGGDDSSPKKNGYVQTVKNMLDYLEFTWARSVVAYGPPQRQNLIDNLDSRMSRAAVAHGQYMGVWSRRIHAYLENIEWRISNIIVGASIVAGSVGMLATLGWFIRQRFQLRQRAKRIGLDDLPTTQQFRLVRQLGFYDDLLRVLERHKLVRPPHLTPLEFSASLAHLPLGVYDNIGRLTQLFYRIRFGSARLNPRRHEHLTTIVKRIEFEMDSSAAGAHAAVANHPDRQSP